MIDHAEMSLSTCQRLAQQLRADSIRCTTAAGSGHPTSAMSAADLMAVLFARHLRYDFSNPHRPDNDRLIFSKGHAAPLLYAMFRAAEVINDEELLSLRRFGSVLEGHPTPRLRHIDAATGSLGQGLAIGVGAALAGKYLDQRDFRTWVLLGDSEMAEGSVAEAMEEAAYYATERLIAIIDVNRLGQRGQTELGWDVERYRSRCEGFGWQTAILDGHDVDAIDVAYRRATRSERPFAIIARTVKGHGVSFTADQEGWHGRAMTDEEARRALTELDSGPRLTVVPNAPTAIAPTSPVPAPAPATKIQRPAYRQGQQVATREAYGETLAALGNGRSDLIVLDAEVSNSTFADRFRQAHPGRFFEMFIAEQAMISIAQGLSIPSRKVVFCSTFAAFLTRAFDQIRMAAVSGADLRVCGSHAGVSIGEDGPSQMGLEDLAMMRTIHGSAVLYPADAVAASRLVEAMAGRSGISYIRTTRGKTPVLYADDEQFPIGGAKVLRSSPADRATLIGAGITLHEALAAADTLRESGVAVRVIDCYSVKPVDAEILRRAADETGHLIVCEDHRPEGGIGEAVLSALAADGHGLPRFSHLAVRGMPGSGKPQEQMESNGICALSLVAAVRSPYKRVD